MDTKLSVEQILLGLRNSKLWNKRNDIMIPNLSWGLLNYEADFVVMSKSGYLTEVEIKRSFEDFKADFKKNHKHDDERVYYFYYCVPEKIYDKVISFLQSEKCDNFHTHIPGVLYYTEKGDIFNTGFGCPERYGKRRKLFLEEQLKIARLGQLRYWNLLEKTLDKSFK